MLKWWSVQFTFFDQILPKLKLNLIYNFSIVKSDQIKETMAGLKIPLNTQILYFCFLSSLFNSLNTVISPKIIFYFVPNFWNFQIFGTLLQENRKSAICEPNAATTFITIPAENNISSSFADFHRISIFFWNFRRFLADDIDLKTDIELADAKCDLRLKCQRHSPILLQAKLINKEKFWRWKFKISLIYR